VTDALVATDTSVNAFSELLIAVVLLTGALVYLRIAVLVGVSGLALASVLVYAVAASATVHAWG
jgi:hypothetical protein